MATKPKAVLLMGPTASGKSALAVSLAHALNAEIISVDSALVYRGMDIGTAKPTPQERQGIAHHLIDILDPAESFSTGQFRDHALRTMSEISARGKLPLLVGGTLLYFSALTHGLAQLPAAHPDIRQRLDRELAALGSAVLHQRLQTIDPASARRIHPHDPQRILRALEVYEISGQPLSQFFAEQAEHDAAYDFIKLVIAPTERSTLHTAIAQRFDLMLAQGFIDEVAALRARGDLHLGLPSMRCVGYRQAWAYLDGNHDFTTMRSKAISATRQLAKRQLTWLRKEQGAHHLETAAVRLLDDAVAYCLRQGL